MKKHGYSKQPKGMPKSGIKGGTFSASDKGKPGKGNKKTRQVADRYL